MLKSKIRVYSSRLKEYETKYGLSTDVFLEKFGSGELGDEERWFEWFADAEIVEVIINHKFLYCF